MTADASFENPNMTVKKFLIVGSGGREGAFATNLAKDTKLYAIIGHENPTILKSVKDSGGMYTIGNPDDPKSVLDFATRYGIDYAFVSADDPLANGVVDTLLKEGFKAVGGTREATKIEWDKIHAINMMKNECPEFTPFYKIASSIQDVQNIIKEFESKNIQAVIKPQGLTGGKGVKVMPEHLHTYKDCTEYATSLLTNRPDENVLVVERLEGIEFTIMGITDGKNMVLSPASYDYPFRYENDTGPGTGGMGCFTNREKKLPFMTDADLNHCKDIMQKIINKINSNGVIFKGVLNGGFFKTKDGIKFMEFNGRFGDPESLNILSVLDGSLAEIIIKLWEGKLVEDDVCFAKKSSVVKYLVAKEYPNPSKEELEFTLDEDEVDKLGIKVLFATCVKTGKHQYKTLKKSRVLAFVATADDIPTASSAINNAIKRCITGPLEYRQDIGSAENLEKLQTISQNS